ncbi:MAG: type 4a pilus biogenesis protein PilO [Chthonomonas sp.]|nr:type 4a pilus biogenesis protein PilO [Chthonomonas sp.]
MKGWNIMIGVCLALLATIAALDFFVPKPKSPLNPAAKQKQLVELTDEAKQAKEQLSAESAFVSSQLWTENEAEIGPAVLTEVKTAATSQGLNLKSFRPQRSVQESRIERYPFQVNVEGAFPNVLSFVANLEAPGTRLGVSLVQCSALDGDRTTVAATIAIVAVRDREAKPAVVSKEPTKPATDKPAVEKVEKGVKKDA